MAELGEIKRGKEINKKSGRGFQKYMWVACQGCGRQSWVKLVMGKVVAILCKKCAAKTAKLKRMGSQNVSWKGGQYRHSEGYICVLQPEHPKAMKNGYVMRARLILEQKLGRYLLDGCEPHHKNEIRDDDRPENLEELTRSDHIKLHRKVGLC